MAFNETVLNFGDNSAPKGNDGTTKRKDAELWINIVIPVQVKNDETGETETQYINIGGVGLDTLLPTKLGRQDSDYNRRGAARNAYLKQLVERGMAMEPGGVMAAPKKLELQIRRVGEKQEIAATEDSNPYLTSLD
jgi:hypothetical protein